MRNEHLCALILRSKNIQNPNTNIVIFKFSMRIQWKIESAIHFTPHTNSNTQAHTYTHTINGQISLFSITEHYHTFYCHFGAECFPFSALNLPLLFVGGIESNHNRNIERMKQRTSFFGVCVFLVFFLCVWDYKRAKEFHVIYRR